MKRKTSGRHSSNRQSPIGNWQWVALLALVLTTTARAQETHIPVSPAGSITIEQPPADKPNLIRNGDFEQADPADPDSPAHWQKIDNLVHFWTTDPADPQRGKVMKIDTDVNQRQAYAWWVPRFLKNAPLAQAPAKEPTVEPKYDTIAGLDGGFYWSDYIPIKKGGAYKVYVDAKGGSSKVFIRGYVKELPLSFADESPAVQQVFRKARGEPEVSAKGKPIRYRLRYLYTTWFAVGGSDQWQTYTHFKPRHPNSREITEDVMFIRIMIYPYWPPNVYWYDNIRVIEVPPDATQAMPEGEEADIEEGKIVR